MTVFNLRCCAHFADASQEIQKLPETPIQEVALSPLVLRVREERVFTKVRCEL